MHKKDVYQQGVAGSLVGQGGEQEGKGTCKQRRAEKWGSGCILEKCFGATPFRLA